MGADRNDRPRTPPPTPLPFARSRMRLRIFAILSAHRHRDLAMVARCASVAAASSAALTRSRFSLARARSSRAAGHGHRRCEFTVAGCFGPHFETQARFRCKIVRWLMARASWTVCGLQPLMCAMGGLSSLRARQARGRLPSRRIAIVQWSLRPWGSTFCRHLVPRTRAASRRRLCTTPVAGWSHP